MTPPVGKAPDGVLLGLIAPLLRRWRLLVGGPIAVGLITAIISLIVRPTFTATATFLPEAAGEFPSSNGLLGLAGQLGINLGTSPGMSSDFFAQVLTSRELLVATLMSTFRDSTAGKPVREATLLAILEPKGRTPAERLDNALRDFQRDVATRVDRRSGLVTLSVDCHRAQLAADIANRMLSLLNDFNLQRRQSRFAEQRRFVGERLKVVEADLRRSEDAQLRFLMENRRYQESPVLTFEAERLARDVALRQEVFQTLAREYEQAKIAEVRDTPVLTVVDSAVVPQRRSAPKRKLLVLGGLLSGAFLAAAVIYAGEYQQALRRQPTADYREFSAAWNAFRQDVFRRRRRGT